jgi:hypothetical protein
MGIFANRCGGLLRKRQQLFVGSEKAPSAGNFARFVAKCGYIHIVLHRAGRKHQRPGFEARLHPAGNARENNGVDPVVQQRLRG